MHRRLLSLLLSPASVLVALSSDAVPVPFAGTFSLGGKATDATEFYPSIMGLGVFFPYQTTGSGTAEVEFVGTAPQTVQIPASAFLLNTGNAFGLGSYGAALNTSVSARTESAVFSDLTSSPSASLAITSSYYSGWNNSIFADFPDPDEPWNGYGYIGAVDLPVNRIGVPGPVVDGGFVDDAQFPWGRETYTWNPAPWSVSSLGSEIRAESYGALNCTGAFGTCSGATFGATLVLDLALDPGQTGFGPGTGQASLLGGAGTTGGLDILLDVTSGEGLLAAAFQAATLTDIEGLYGVLPFALPAGGPTSLWTIEGGEQFQGTATLTFGYDPGLLPAGYDETLLAIAHFVDGVGWELLTGAIDLDAKTITVQTDSFSPFSLVAVPEPGTGGLVVAGLLGLALRRKRRA